MQPVWHARASGLYDQAPEYTTVRPEHSDVVAEEVRRYCELMCGGVFKPHGGWRGGVYRGGGDFQITGKDVGPVRWRMASGLSERWEFTPIMESDG